MLVHMTPGEVHGLQALAMKHGGSLTINPTTGLPEANFLKSLLPMLAGFALGPAGFGLMSAGMAGLTVGGVTALATGSLSKGLMAGLGAYGGAGLGASLAGAGEGALSSQITDELAKEKAAEIAAGQLGEEEIGKMATQRLADTSMTSKLGAGLGAITESPATAMNFAKQNLMPLGAAAAPILADQMVPTTTKAPVPTNPGRIIEKRWNGREFVDVANTDAGVFNSSGRTFSDLNRGYKDGGGIVALADGGPPTALTDEQLFQKTGSWEAAAAARDAQNNALNQYNWQQQAAAANAANAAKLNTTAADYVKAASLPTETTADFISGANTAGIGLTQPLATALQNSGLSAGAQYALTHANIGADENAAETYGGLKGLSSNINYALNKYNADTANKFKTADQKRAEARAALGKDLTEADVVRATGMTIDQLFPKTTTVTPTGVYGEYGNNTGVAATTTPGDIGMNSDGTVTVFPNIPGRPPGGFTGMGQVVDTYTKGGGRTGYIPYVPKTIDEFNAKYADRMSGDSKAAYDYLTGKAGAAYPVKSNFNGQLSQDYATAVLGYPARGNLPYIYNKTTGKMDANPDYISPGRDAKGNVTYGMSLNDIKKSLGDNPLQGQALYDWAQTNNLSAQQIADATGQSLSQVYAQFRAGAKNTAAKTDATGTSTTTINGTKYDLTNHGVQPNENYVWSDSFQKWVEMSANGGLQGYADGGYAVGGGLGSLGSYSDGGRLLKGPGDGVSDSIPATIGQKQQPARLADGEFVVPARIVSELGNGSTDAGAKKLYAMMDRVQRARGKTTGKNKVAANSRADKYLPA
jgi:hypothetical protein